MKQKKKEMRAAARERLASVTFGGNEKPSAVADLFFEHLKPSSDQSVAVYWSQDREFDTSELLERLLEHGHRCALPVVLDDTREMKFACWEQSVRLRKGRFDILEPESSDFIAPDIVIVPLLAFDKYGTRLGRGGGYYDATLAALRAKADILAVGVAYVAQESPDALPKEGHDQQLDVIITPQKFWDFRK